MNSVLPPHITSDAVPDKRTADEENQPPTPQEASEYIERNHENVQECGQNNEREGSGDPNTPSTSPEKPDKKSEAGSQEKSKKKKKPSNSTTSIVNISHCSGFQLCNNTNVSNNWFMNGLPNTLHKSSSANSNSTQDQKTDSHRRTNLPIPEKVFRCLEKVTDEDCIIVSEYVACDWKTLGKQLFRDNLDYLKEYASQIKKKSKKEAVLMILIRWKQINWKLADVRQLCLALEKLDEIEAIIKVANSHELK